MPAAAAGDEGDVFGGGGGGVDDFVGSVEGEGGVGEGNGVEGGVDEVGWVVDEVFCCERFSLWILICMIPLELWWILELLVHILDIVADQTAVQ